MIQFKSKSIKVVVGADAVHFMNVAITTEKGTTIALPFEVFKELFDPDNDEAIEWYKALDKKLHPVAADFDDQPGPRFPSRLFGKS